MKTSDSRKIEESPADPLKRDPPRVDKSPPHCKGKTSLLRFNKLATENALAAADSYDTPK
jgi:hypothetical protein